MNVNVVINFQETIYENNQKDVQNTIKVHNTDLTADVLLYMRQKMIMMEKMT